MKVAFLVSGLLMAGVLPIAEARAIGAQVMNFQRIPPSVTRDLACFMHTSGGYSIDLTPLCPKNKEESGELTANDLVAKFCQARRRGASESEAFDVIYAAMQTESARQFGGSEAERMARSQKYSLLMQEVMTRLPGECA